MSIYKKKFVYTILSQNLEVLFGVDVLYSSTFLFQK